MADDVLTGCRILVAEDEYFLAADTARLLAQAGATIIGPIGTLEQLRKQVEQDGFDIAVLDIRLDQELIYPAADLIRQCGVPIAFLTGYDDTVIPPRFADVPLCQKPCPDDSLIAIVSALCRRR